MSFSEDVRTVSSRRSRKWLQVGLYGVVVVGQAQVRAINSMRKKGKEAYVIPKGTWPKRENKFIVWVKPVLCQVQLGGPVAARPAGTV